MAVAGSFLGYVVYRYRHQATSANWEGCQRLPIIVYNVESPSSTTFYNKAIKTSKDIVQKPRINLSHRPWTFMRNSMACDALNAQHLNYLETLKAFWVLSSPPMQIINITTSACMTLLVARLGSPSRCRKRIIAVIRKSTFKQRSSLPPSNCRHAHTQ
ncbi:hypothetical protein NC652_028827 [Populus alba x Populus x berolinensis]|nr:hypothetical protein NC652_028827 [Populus alba x Populus x berolinensis]